MTNDIAYRYSDFSYAPPLNEFDEPCGISRSAIQVEKYRIIKYTPKGIWIEYISSFNDKKFILLSARKQFACLTKAAALISFKTRKTRQQSILQAQLKHLDAVFNLIKIEEK